MKLRELMREADKIEMVEITIGYDDHCSVYLVPVAALDKLSKMKNSGDVNDTIVDNYNRKYTGDDDPCDKGEIFLDNTEHTNSLDKFHQQIRDYKKENLCERRKDRVDRFFGNLASSDQLLDIVHQMNNMVSKNDRGHVNDILSTMFKGNTISQMNDDDLFSFAAELHNVVGKNPKFKNLMKQFLGEEFNESNKLDKLDVETEKHLEQTMAKLSSIKDLDEAKKIAHEFLNKMKFQEKAEKYKNLVSRAKSVKDVIKFVYDVKLAGEGLGVIK